MIGYEEAVVLLRLRSEEDTARTIAWIRRDLDDGCRVGTINTRVLLAEYDRLAARHATVLAYLDQRAGTPGAGPTVPADLIRSMLTEETPA